MTFGAYSTFGTLQAKHVMKIQTCAAEVLALLTSGLTASIGTIAHPGFCHAARNSTTRCLGLRLECHSAFIHLRMAIVKR